MITRVTYVGKDFISSPITIGTKFVWSRMYRCLKGRRPKILRRRRRRK